MDATWLSGTQDGTLKGYGIEIMFESASKAGALTQPLAAARAPNAVWTADFKGWFRTADQTRCDPLTVADGCSRFVLCCHIVAPSERGVRALV